MKINPSILLLKSDKHQLYFHCWLFYLPFSIANRSHQIPSKPLLEHGHQHPPLLVEMIQFHCCNPLQIPPCFPSTTCYIHTLHCPHHLELSVVSQSFRSTKHLFDLPLNHFIKYLSVDSHFSFLRSFNCLLRV